MLDILVSSAWDGLTTSFSGLVEIALIVFPLMLGMELAKDSGIMEKITGWFHPVAKPLGISNQAVFPLLVGFVFGLSYGSGVIISAAKKGDLSKRDRYTIGLFLSVTHSIVEDTLLLAAVGANLIWLVSSRLLLPIVVTILAARTILATELRLRRFRQQSS